MASGLMQREPLVVVVAAVAQLVVWLVLRPDLAGPQWTEGRSLETWLAIEAVVAGAIGAMAPGRRELVMAVIAGWVLQSLHFMLLGDHYDDTLWGIGVVGQVILGALAVGAALVVRALTARARGRRAG
jgi:hypothetical protein